MNKDDRRSAPCLVIVDLKPITDGDAGAAWDPSGRIDHGFFFRGASSAGGW